MVKYLWEMMERFESIVDETPQAKVTRMKKEVDLLLKRLRENPPKDGKPGAQGKPGKDGKNGRHGRDGLPGKSGRDGRPGRNGRDGKPGKDGKIRMAKHEWNGTMIRFEVENGKWGEWVNLQGPPGQARPDGGGPGGGIERIRGVGFERQGASEIFFGNNLTITKTNNGVRIDAEAGGGGTSLNFETPSGTVDDSNVNFTATETPIYLVVNGAQYFEGVHYSLSGLDITLNNPVGSGGFIRSAYGGGISVETPTGTVDDSNVTFTVSNEPKYIVVNGAQYFSGTGYSYSGGTITLNNPVGTGGFIRSVY